MYQLLNYKKKVVIISGASNGIGKATAECFAKQGAIVFNLDLNEENNKEINLNNENFEGTITFIKCNIANQKEVLESVNKIIQIAGSVNILINNAGLALVGNVEQTLVEDFERLLSVNVKGVYYLTQAVIPYMKLNGGVILNMASVSVLVGLRDRFAYSLTKSAIVGITLSIARDYIEYGIRCNCISPARVDTPFVSGFIEKNYPGREDEIFEKLSRSQPIGRMAKPEEIAFLALYLCSDEAAFITGCNYPIDGGFIHLNTDK